MLVYLQTANISVNFTLDAYEFIQFVYNFIVIVKNNYLII